MYPFIHIGTLTFESYTMMTNLGTVCGLFAAYLVLEKYCRREKYYWTLIPFLFAVMVIGDPWARLVKGMFGGIVEIGSTHFLARVLLACILLPFYFQFVWKDEKSKEQALNAAALYVVIQHFCNRAACWMNGCCGGIYVEAINKTVPTQLFEAGMMALLTMLLLICIRSKKPFYRWTCTGYAAVIFVSECLIDQPGIGRLFNMTSIQAAALLLVLWLWLPIWKRNACQKKNFKV